MRLCLSGSALDFWLAPSSLLRWIWLRISIFANTVRAMAKYSTIFENDRKMQEKRHASIKGERLS